jgi:superfamily II DNA or RNA helicase
MPARLEELTPGTAVRGVVPGEPVLTVAVEWHGSSCVTLTYRNSGGDVAQRLVYRADEPGLDLDGGARAWTFDADGHLFRLAAEARRIRLAYLFDPRLAVHLSLLEPLPHQIKAVYGDLLPRQPLRFALCDDPGAGKTIMAGLYMKELLLRGALRRCLVVAPGALVTQWQDEMAERFGMTFAILTRDMIEATRLADPFAEHDLMIARLDHLARNDDLVALLGATEWDLVVVDEAHKMSAHYFGSELKETKRYRLGKVLGQVARHFLLMTATPHAGKDEDFQLFLALLDPDRFEGKPREKVRKVDVSDLMRRTIKERLLRFDGRPLFPERVATTVSYPLSNLEAALYADVTAYVSDEMNRAERLSNEGDGRRGNRVGFAVTILQRRLASSPEAIYQSLRRRRERLEERHREERAKGPGEVILEDRGPDVDEDDVDDYEDAERLTVEEELVDDATSARTLAELEAEIEIVRGLEVLAERVRRSGTDRKWNELAGLISEQVELVDPATGPLKLIVFTEHRDTLNYVADKLRGFLGRAEAVLTIHGGVHRDDRRRIQEVFTQDPDCLILVATDAAGEGINLQRAHLVVNYDLPWNPNRIEQRFGRVHRIGQTEVCHLWNLLAEGTREGDVYLRLLSKLEEQRRALGGEVFDVLGAAMPGRALRELLVEAIRYGDRPDVRARLNEIVDQRIGEGLAELVAEHGLAADVLDTSDIEQIRRDMAEAEARRLQPHYVRAWFSDAFERLGGRMAEREPGRFEVVHVPEAVRGRARPIGSASPVLRRYERVTFEKHLMRPDHQAPAELLAPGHPLLEAVLELTLERHEALLQRGTTLIDDADDGDMPHVLAFLEHAVTDGHQGTPGRQVISRRFQFVDIARDGSVTTAGYAPYLDYRAATPQEEDALKDLRDETWLGPDLERRALDHAVEVSVAAHLAEVRTETEARVAKVRAAVRDRLMKEIAHWDLRAQELRDQMQAGKQPRMNPDRAQARADDLAARLKARLVDLNLAEQISALPPVVAGAALVVPAGLLARLQDLPAGVTSTAAQREAVERRAVDAVLASEEALGRHPTEMHRTNPGFDIQSEAPGGRLIFIEVKGRVSGADTFVVTRNEILHGLNVPGAWVLALVEVSPEGPAHDGVRYLRRPFGEEVHLPFATTSATLSWRDYWERGGSPS